MRDTLKTAIVTGASQGIGKSIAIALLRQGHRVIAIARSEQKLAELAAAHADVGARLICEPLDITDGEQFSARMDGWIKSFGPISHLVNAAGILAPGKLLEASRKAIRDVFEINLLATLDVSLTVARHMAEERAGSIITIASIAGITARMGVGSYPASKAGIIHAMKCLGLELAEYGVRSNIVSPGPTNTEMQQLYQATTGSLQGVLEGDLKLYRLGIPLRRIAEPEDICELVRFLLSDKARHITLQNIIVDGGATLGG